MRKKINFMISLSLLVFALVACSEEKSESSNPKDKQNVEKVEDKNSEKLSENDNVLRNEPKVDGLNYVDLKYVDNLISNVTHVSSNRTSYSEPIPEWGFYLIDVREDNEFASGHINGAINIPYNAIEENSNLLPKNKETSIILYSNNSSEKIANDVAFKLQDEGFNNVSIFYDGVDAWAKTTYLGVTQNHIKELITEKKDIDATKDSYLLIDAMPNHAYLSKHIPTAINVEDTDFEDRYASVLPTDKETNIIAYCGGFIWGKSHNVAQGLVQLGYTNVKVFAGGIPKWESEGFPMVTNRDKSDEIIDYNKLYIDAAQYLELEKEKVKFHIVDARKINEYNLNHLENAVHIPHNSFEQNQDKLTAEKNELIVVYSNEGKRAELLVQVLRDKGYEKAVFLRDTVNFQEDGSATFAD